LLKRRGESHPEVFDESVDAIDTEADRMQQLVNQMLDLAKNKQTASKVQLNFINLTKKIVQTFQAAYNRDIFFHTDSDSIFVKGNREQLEQVVYILLSNAIQYSEKEIDIHLIQEGDHTFLHVIDKGPGISKADQNHIFDRFYRVDKARTRKSGGTGLGLAIAKTISDIHDGSLTVQSKEGEGATFILRLPKVRGEEE